MKKSFLAFGVAGVLAVGSVQAQVFYPQSITRVQPDQRQVQCAPIKMGLYRADGEMVWNPSILGRADVFAKDAGYQVVWDGINPPKFKHYNIGVQPTQNISGYRTVTFVDSGGRQRTLAVVNYNTPYSGIPAQLVMEWLGNGMMYAGETKAGSPCQVTR